MATIPDNSGITLRDQRHAHNFYVQNNHAFSPKVKFLYHIVFALRDWQNSDVAPASSTKLTEIAVMAKSVDLPRYRVQLETKQQYNRKKNLQTRVDYDPVRFTFHDDNTGLTRKMLEEYYTYYFRDGKKDGGAGVPTDFDPLDKYKSLNAKYGMDNEVTNPFFDYIKIFQFAQREWYSYTLINPILTSWEHDNLEYASSDPVENTLNIAYEGVLYNSGAVSDGGATGFGSDATRYDVVDSPLKDSVEYYGDFPIVGGNKLGISQSANFPTVNASQVIATSTSQIINLDDAESGGFTGLQGLIFPIGLTQATATLSTLPAADVALRDPDQLVTLLTLPSNKSILISLTKKVLAAGFFSNDWNVNNFSNFSTLPQNEKDAIVNSVLNSLETDIRIQKIASSLLDSTGTTA